MNDNETIPDIIACLRRPREGENAYLTLWRDEIANRLEAAYKREMSKNVSKNRADFGQLGDCAKLREAQSIERIVRDAIIDYQEMYPNAPNNEAERDLIDRANRGNAWLVSHGYEPEKTFWDKEEVSCP